VKTGCIAALIICSLTAVAGAQDFTGVQPAALDQPRIFVNLRRSLNAPALTAKVEGQSLAAIECFLDTGASSVVFSANTSKGLGLQYQRTAAGTPVKYEDVGVGGSESFGVSEPLYAATAPYSSDTDGTDAKDYSASVGPFRSELRTSASFVELVAGDLDVVGMPIIEHHVIVMDVRPVNSFSDKIKTSLVLPGSRAIPAVDEHVPLTPISFASFTEVIPAGAQGPAIAPNLMIGPDPFGDSAKGVAPIARFNKKAVSLTMLLDTGAVTSMISRDVAKQLGVTYSADGSTLVGVPADQQFSLDVGGIGGQKTSRGFYLDCLQLPTDQKKPLRYFKAPVLVSDISVTNPKTGKTYTLDGVFGMNYLVASVAITGGLIPDLGKMVQGPFSFVAIDPDRGTLGLKLKQ
jgi:hypothetical protein